jgi:hypothetical protein
MRFSACWQEKTPSFLYFGEPRTERVRSVSENPVIIYLRPDIERAPG